jgi:hypothetical protein
LHRLELHADAHFTDRTRIFVQLENALAPGRERPRTIDANRADLRLAFIHVTKPLWDGEYQLRAGRQEVAFDLQRFASVRDGANVRQAFDAVWMQYTRDKWLLAAFASEPVQYRNASVFDDRSDRHFMFGGVRAKRRLAGTHNLSLTLSTYQRDGRVSAPANVRERRRNIDVHYAGSGHGFDWDIEAMVQRGTFGHERVKAWAAGSLAGYTFDALAWRPRFGLQLDAASGDSDPTDGFHETFNPLFPNGYYINLSGYTGYANLVHLKPSLTLQPARGVRLLLAQGILWRESTRDAVFAQPGVPVAGTAGKGGARTARYAQLRLDWVLTRSLAVALEADRYDVAPAIRAAGGRDSRYLAAELRWAW